VSLPKEIADLIFSYFSRYKYRYRIRQVSKKWLMAAKISNFVIGYFLKAEIAQIAKSFSMYYESSWLEVCQGLRGIS
jgi:hypothetical protein